MFLLVKVKLLSNRITSVV